jgi:hypothetical protein
MGTLAEKQSSITIYCLPTKESNTFVFPFPFPAKIKWKLAVPGFHLQQTAGNCRIC